MATSSGPNITRRAVLAGLGGLGGAFALAACTSDAKISTGTGTGTGTGTAPGGTGAAARGAPTGDVNLVPRFDQNLYAVSGQEQRLVVSFLNKAGDTPNGLPSTIEFVASRDGKPVGAPTRATSHQDGVPVPYFPVLITPDLPGDYTLTANFANESPTTTFKVVLPKSNPVLRVGQKMPTADTPTTKDARGVTPICTRVGKNGPNPCPLHDLNLKDALSNAKPVALLISTPAYCQIGVCGPVLELVLEMRDKYPNVQFIHAEVYKNPGAGSHDTAPIVDAYGLNYEPALFLAAADGTVIVQRLDSVFDRSEIRAGLDLLK